jgi:two-component system response regulator ResD
MKVQPEILIVEDEKPIRDLIKKWLVKAGYNCIEASDGVEALERFREYNGDIKLVILDIMMPRMDGIELLHEIREESISKAPVIICTGSDIKKLSHLDVFAIFSKPIDHKEFMEKVERGMFFGSKQTTIMEKIKNVFNATDCTLSETENEA